MLFVGLALGDLLLTAAAVTVADHDAWLNGNSAAVAAHCSDTGAGAAAIPTCHVGSMRHHMVATSRVGILLTAAGTAICTVLKLCGWCACISVPVSVNGRDCVFGCSSPVQ